MLWRINVVHCALCLLLLTAGTGHSAGVSFVVKNLPLTTEAQKARGIEGGEGFQMVMSLVFAPSDELRVYLASDTSQVWRSKDGGWRWEPCNNGYFSLGSSSLFIHPTNPEIVFSAANLGVAEERCIESDQHQGIYRTVDGGDSWRFLAKAVYCKQESRGSLFALDSRTLLTENFTIYTGQYDGGILVSHDSGATWQDTGINAGRVIDMLEHPARPGVIMFCTDKGLFQYENGEMTKIGGGLPAHPLSIAGSTSRPETFFVALGKHGVYVSWDGGLTFEQSLSGSVYKSSFTDVEVSHTNPDVVIANLTGKRGSPYYSRDGGRSWSRADNTNSKRLTEGKGFYFSSPLAMHPTDANVALTSSNGKARVLRTEDGGANWFFSGSGYCGGRLTSVHALPGGELIFGLTDHGAWLTRNAGDTFSFLGHPSNGGLSIGGIAAKGDTIALSVGGWAKKGLVISHSHGSHWSSVEKVTGGLRLVQFHLGRPHTIYAGGFRSDDGGRNWLPLHYELLAVNPSDNDVVYAMDGTQQRLLMSHDQGDSWSQILMLRDFWGGKITSLVVDPFHPDRLLVGTNRGVMEYAQGAWRRLDTSATKDSFGNEYIGALSFHPHIEDLVFAGKRSPGKGMGNGLWYSVDRGKTWKPVALGTVGTNTNIFSINCLPNENTMYVGTAHGVFKVDVTLTPECS